MRRWRIVEVQDGTDDDLTDGELLGISVFLTQYGTEFDIGNNDSVYWRARQKIQPAVRVAIQGEDEPER